MQAYHVVLFRFVYVTLSHNDSFAFAVAPRPQQQTSLSLLDNGAAGHWRFAALWSRQQVRPVLAIVCSSSFPCGCVWETDDALIGRLRHYHFIKKVNLYQRACAITVLSFVATSGLLLTQGRNRTLFTPVEVAFQAA